MTNEVCQKLEQDLAQLHIFLQDYLIQENGQAKIADLEFSDLVTRMLAPYSAVQLEIMHEPGLEHLVSHWLLNLLSNPDVEIPQDDEFKDELTILKQLLYKPGQLIKNFNQDEVSLNAYNLTLLINTLTKITLIRYLCNNFKEIENFKAENQAACDLNFPSLKNFDLAWLQSQFDDIKDIVAHPHRYVKNAQAKVPTKAFPMVGGKEIILTWQPGNQAAIQDAPNNAEMPVLQVAPPPERNEGMQPIIAPIANQRRARPHVAADPLFRFQENAARRRAGPQGHPQRRRNIVNHLRQHHQVHPRFNNNPPPRPHLRSNDALLLLVIGAAFAAYIYRASFFQIISLSFSAWTIVPIGAAVIGLAILASAALFEVVRNYHRRSRRLGAISADATHSPADAVLTTNLSHYLAQSQSPQAAPLAEPSLQSDISVAQSDAQEAQPRNFQRTRLR